jgi:hypothetical protein
MWRERYFYCFKVTNPGAARLLLHQHGASSSSCQAASCSWKFLQGAPGAVLCVQTQPSFDMSFLFILPIKSADFPPNISLPGTLTLS